MRLHLDAYLNCTVNVYNSLTSTICAWICTNHLLLLFLVLVLVLVDALTDNCLELVESYEA